MKTPKLSRCAFELIAATIRDSNIDAQARDEIARSFSIRLSGTNENFKRDKFIRACGIDETDTRTASERFFDMHRERQRQEIEIETGRKA